MDLHDGLGDGGEQGRWEPSGLEADPAATAPDDGTADTRGHDGAGGDDDAGTGSGDSAAGGTMIVEVDGETRELPAERDYTGDGRPDAVTETPDGRVIVFTDTEDNETGAAGPDGRADEAYVVDKATGRVVGAAHVDPASGKWVEGMDTGRPTAARSDDPEAEQAAVVDPQTGRAVEVSHVDPETGEWEEGPAPGTGGTADPADPSGTPGDHGGTGGTGGTMIVDLGGETRELRAERDYTGDGRPDAAAETSSGRVIVFADTEDNETGATGPDGRADEAYVVDKQTGRVVGAAHVDPRTGEWVEGADPDGSPSAPSPTGGEVDS
jgi:hypothetical protein